MTNFEKITMAALTIFALNTNAQGAIQTFDGLEEERRAKSAAAATARRLAIVDPALLKKIEEDKKATQEAALFPGEGHRLGGDKYVNRPLKIDHKEGKAMAKAVHNAKKKLSALKKPSHLEEPVVIAFKPFP